MECGTQFERYSSAIRPGKGIFCSISCATRYRNLRNNPAKNEAVRAKISKNHADVSGKNNPMYGKRGALCPSYIDGRTHFKGDRYRQKLLANTKKEDLKCALCESTQNLQVHHKDGNHNNNDFLNLVWLCKSCHRNIAHEYIRDEKGRFKEIKTYNFFWG
jgi:hypothetical protein